MLLAALRYQTLLRSIHTEFKVEDLLNIFFKALIADV